MEIKYEQAALKTICDKAVDSFLKTKEEEIYEVAIKELPLSVFYEKKKKEIIGKLDYDLLYFLFNSMKFEIKSGYYFINKCIKRERSVSDEEETIYKGTSYLAESKKRACLIIHVPHEYEKIAIESFPDAPEIEGTVYYKISSPLITSELVEQKATMIMPVSDYGLNLGENYIEPRTHFLSFLESQIKINKANLFYLTIQNTYNMISRIDKYTKEDFFEKDRKRFVRNTLRIVVEEQDSDSFRSQFSNVVDCISSIDSCEDVVSSFVSYLHAMASLNYIKDKTMLDYTQQALGLFKAAEIIFYDLLRDKCNGFYYTKKGGTVGFKDISERSKTTLGDLSRVFYTTDDRIRMYFSGRNLNRVKGIINDWINYDRNDHLHKDIMRAKEDLLNSLSSTLEVIFELVDIFY